MRSLLRMTKTDKYQKAVMELNRVDYNIRLRPRGNNRLQTCSFPPITLNFKKTGFEDSSYNQLEKLKLVNPCRTGALYEQYVLREYLIYKIFNLLTEYSFKVRLLKIEFIDSQDKMKPIEQFGFVIEDQDMLARRMNGMVIKKQGLADKVTNGEQMVLLSVFQYMIGNTDWQVAALQNLKLIKLMDFTEPAPYVIPYDFDYTGMVNASYAIPSDKLPIKNIRERLYWGKCYSEEELAVAIDNFLHQKNEIYELYNDFPYFSKNSLSEAINYLDSFYRIIEDKKTWQRIFIRDCKE